MLYSDDGAISYQRWYVLSISSRIPSKFRKYISKYPYRSFHYRMAVIYTTSAFHPYVYYIQLVHQPQQTISSPASFRTLLFLIWNQCLPKLGTIPFKRFPLIKRRLLRLTCGSAQRLGTSNGHPCLSVPQFKRITSFYHYLILRSSAFPFGQTWSSTPPFQLLPYIIE